jgi:hypothetical protein
VSAIVEHQSATRMVAVDLLSLYLDMLEPLEPFAPPVEVGDRDALIHGGGPQLIIITPDCASEIGYCFSRQTAGPDRPGELGQVPHVGHRQSSPRLA